MTAGVDKSVNKPYLNHLGGLHRAIKLAYLLSWVAEQLIPMLKKA